MTVDGPVHDVGEVLAGVRSMMESDGYLLETSWGEDGSLVLRIVAGPEACTDCLVPKELMAQIVTKVLADNGVTVAPTDLRLEYPVDSR